MCLISRSGLAQVSVRAVQYERGQGDLTEARGCRKRMIRERGK